MTGITFEKLSSKHVEDAAKIALSGYMDERAAVPALPEADYYNSVCRMINALTDSDLGTVALENGNVVGYLTCYPPMQNHFGTAKGVFSPLHGHGAVKENRAKIYARLYQVASEEWVKAGILSHTLSLFAHSEAVNSFFWSGFGLRCVDAVREVKPILVEASIQVKFYELPGNEIEAIVPLKNQLIKHLQSTPMYMPLFYEVDAHKLKQEAESRKSRFFVAELDHVIAAYVEIMDSGENYVCDYAGMMNICGAYMLPQYRGSGVYQKLVAFLVEVLETERYTHCGVDFESFNPTASGFWTKYFIPYTYSLTRRIDERIVKNYL